MSNGNSSEIAQDIPGMQVQPQRNYRGLVMPIIASVGFAAIAYYLFIEGDE